MSDFEDLITELTEIRDGAPAMQKAAKTKPTLILFFKPKPTPRQLLARAKAVMKADINNVSDAVTAQRKATLRRMAQQVARHPLAG